MLVLANGASALAHNSDFPLGVGSAFKLAVMDALQQEVTAHTLCRQWRSTRPRHVRRCDSGVVGLAQRFQLCSLVVHCLPRNRSTSDCR